MNSVPTEPFASEIDQDAKSIRALDQRLQEKDIQTSNSES